VPPLLPHLPAKELISPNDSGVTFPEYRSVWYELSPFEKALVYWAEVNAFALRLERAAGVPWLRVRYEDLFGDAGETLAELVAFAGGAVENVSEADRAMGVDRHRFALSEWPDLARLSRHPAVAHVAMQLGYRLEDYAADRISARFMLPPESRV
jgi:hypothetical protein